jgi:DHA1 family inner membrane transport protein
MGGRLALIALMFGNFMTGVSVLAPAAMLNELARDLSVSVATAGLLITIGAVILCVGSPVMAGLTSQIDRRVLLAATLFICALGHLASALAPNYAALLLIRAAMMVAAVIYTPQAAGTVALFVPEKDRPGAIAFVFLGWSLAIAGGLFLVSLIATRFGWREAYAAIGVFGFVSCALIAACVPRGLRGAPVSLATWGKLATNRLVVLLLLLTGLQTSAQFLIFTYLGPLLSRLANAAGETIGIFFAIFGTMGLIGNVIATRIVGSLDVARTSLACLLSMLLGMALWTAGAGSLPVMAVGVAFWGLGFASLNSMQQARLVGAAPDFAGASVSLNTSTIYLGQAAGSAIGGVLFAHEPTGLMGGVAIAFALAALGVLGLTWERKRAAA